MPKYFGIYLGFIMSEKEKNAKPIVFVMDKEQQLLKTPQSLIHVRHEMTLLQYKYWLLILHFAAQTEAKEINTAETFIGKMFVIPKSYIVSYLKYYPKNKELEQDLQALRKYDLVYNLMKKDKQGVMNLTEQMNEEIRKKHQYETVYYSGMIGAFGITEKEIHVEVPIILLNIMRKMIEKERTDNIFQLLNWDIYNKFPSKYTAAIYKLCKDYLGIGYVKSLSIEDFRFYIGLQSDEYEPFKLLNYNIIKPSIQEINESEFSDISVGVEYKKIGKRVTHLQFIVKAKKVALPSNIHTFEQPIEYSEPDLAQEENIGEIGRIYGLVRENSLPVSTLKKWVEQKGFDFVQATLIRANRRADETRIKKPNEPMNYGAWYTNAFKNNFGGEELEEQLLKEQQLKKQRELDEKKAKAKAEKAAAEAKLKAEQEAEVQEKIDLWYRLPESVKDEIWQTVCGQKRKEILVQHLVRDWEEAQTQDEKNAVLWSGRHRNVFLKFVEPYIQNLNEASQENESDVCMVDTQPETENVVNTAVDTAVKQITTKGTPQGERERIIALYQQLGTDDIQFLLDEFKERLQANGKERLIKLADNLVSQNLPLYHSALLADDFFAMMIEFQY